MTNVGLPTELQHSARTRDDGEPRLTVPELLSIAVPTAPELGYAVRRGWLDVTQTQAIVSAKRAAGASLHSSEQRLLESEIGTAQFGVEAASVKTPDVALESYWLYVFMTWAWRVRPDVPKPSAVVESIFIALDKPHQIAGFAWMARRWGPKVGFLRSRKKAQQLAWRAYLDSERDYYSDRRIIQGAR